MASPAPLIGLLTDFGTSDWYVACLKGVIAAMCPRARIIDLTHDIPPQDVTAGAWNLAAAAPWFPPRTIFACVIDPGVGTVRPLLAAQADEQIFIGPDNGLLSLVLARARRRTLIRLTNPAYWLKDVSQTFHGRDIVAPVAAHLARGVRLASLGVPVTRYQPLPLPVLRQTAGCLIGQVVYIDTFGNLITNLPAAALTSSRRPTVRYHRAPARMVSSYGDGRSGELIAVAGSLGYVELAIPNASAAARYWARRGDRVELLVAPPRRRR